MTDKNDFPKVFALVALLGAEATLELDGWHSDDKTVENILEDYRETITIPSWQPNPWVYLVNQTAELLPLEIVDLYNPEVVIDPGVVY